MMMQKKQTTQPFKNSPKHKGRNSKKRIKKLPKRKKPKLPLKILNPKLRVKLKSSHNKKLSRKNPKSQRFKQKMLKKTKIKRVENL
jgi:hypothetical protein